MYKGNPPFPGRKIKAEPHAEKGTQAGTLSKYANVSQKSRKTGRAAMGTQKYT
jgi:hypothetical protein